VRLTAELDAVVAVSEPGAVGGWVSPPPPLGVEVVMVLEYALRFEFPSLARIRYE
jgi:hypothetical protein